jgi:hypothetical protein
MSARIGGEGANGSTSRSNELFSDCSQDALEKMIWARRQEWDINTVTEPVWLKKNKSLKKKKTELR